MPNLNRPQAARTMQTGGGLAAAERIPVVPERPQPDDARLLALLHSAKRELQGLRLVHFHLSLLAEASQANIPAIRSAFQEIASNSAFLQIFALSNDDLLILYKGIKFSLITDICQAVERLLLPRSEVSGHNAYGGDSLYSILELSLDFVKVIRFVESLEKGQGNDGKGRTKPPITLEELAKIERQMPIFDLSPFMLNQPVVDLRSSDEQTREYFEFYIAVKTLEERVSPEFDIAANRWLFNYFSANLDNSVLKALSYGIEIGRNQSIAINLNLASIMSTPFVKFDERLSPEQRRRVVFEINKSDLVENDALYREVSDFAEQRGYRLCIDGLTPFWASRMDLEDLRADYAKIFWSPDMPGLPGDEMRRLEDTIGRQARCRFVLARCGSVSGLLFAQRHGIDLVQGRMVDNILRKGVSVREAIRTAALLEDA